MAESTTLDELHALANTVRRVYNLMRHTTDQLHSETGITAPKRTLLMDLHRYGPQPVPVLAAARCISRQIIQTQINELKKARLVVARANPQHRRSRLIALSASGQKVVDAMIEAENAFLERLSWLPKKGELSHCRETLESICEQLTSSENAATSERREA